MRVYSRSTMLDSMTTRPRKNALTTQARMSGQLFAQSAAARQLVTSHLVEVNKVQTLGAQFRKQITINRGKTLQIPVLS